MAKKKIITIESKEKMTESGILIPGHDDVRKIAGNEALISIIEVKNDRDDIKATVRKHDENTFIVVDKETGAELRVYVKEKGCEDPEACANSYAKKFN